MKNSIISLIAFFATITNLHSQSQDIAYPHVVPMTPNSAEFAKYGDNPVSYSTGTPNISIPLYEIDVDGFKLPIALNYHASGIRVDQEATWVGLGWTLNVGSRISRVVKSADDFLMEWDRNYPYCTTGYYDAPDITNNLDNNYQMAAFNNCALGEGWSFQNQLIHDPEPDLFYYNLPNLNGKFLLDKSRGAVLFDKSHNLKIEVIRSSNPVMVRFKITDIDGVQFFYNQFETTKNYAASGSLNKNVETFNTVYDSEPSSFTEWTHIRMPDCSQDASPASQTPVPMVTSWCLSKIITKNSREINFVYDSEIQYLPTQESCERYNFNGQSLVYYNKSKVVNNGLRLKAIDGDFGRVDFNSTPRYDIKGDSKKLESVIIKNGVNELIKAYKFNHTYFNDNYSGNWEYEHVFKRLKLDKVIEYSATNVPLNGGYVFNYFEGDFPAKNSKNVDYWGFQNGQNYGQDYYIGIYLPNSRKYLGVKKDANFTKAIIGTLKKITYPTGGIEEFTYESNTMPPGYFRASTADRSSSTATVYLPVYNGYVLHEYPEVPSQRVYAFELQGKTTITITCRLENGWGQNDPNYNYNSPLGRLRKIGSSPITYYSSTWPFVYSESIYQGEGTEITLNDRQFTLEAGSYEFEAYTPPKEVFVEWHLYFDYLYGPVITPGTPQVSFDAGGIRISEIKNDAKIRKFKYPIGNMMFEPVLYYLGRRTGIPDYIASCVVQVSESKMPLSTFNRGNFIGYDWVEEYISDGSNNVSKIKYAFYNDTETEVFDDSFPESPRYINYRNGLVKSIEKYKNSICIEKDVFSYNSTYSSVIKAFKDRGQHKFDSDILGYHYEIEWPLKSQVVNTLNTDEGKSIVTETNYSYNSKDLIQFLAKKSSDESLLITEYKYPHDFVGQQPYTDMVNVKHIWSPVIEQSSYKNSVASSNLLQSSKTNYTFWNSNSNQIYPKSVENKGLLTNYETKLRFHSYDNQGNIKTVSIENGLKVNYLYSYKGQYPIAKIENAEYNAVESALGGAAAVEALRNTVSPTDTYLAGIFTTLRNSLFNAQVTGYSYKPLVGITSLTDPRGQKTTYEYDSFQRLSTVKDHAGNIVKQYCYNYAGQQTTCYNVGRPAALVIPNPGGGGSGTQTIYVRAEYENPFIYNGYNGPYRIIQESRDVYLRFYTDAACTQPSVLTSSLNISSYLETTHSYNGGVDAPSYDSYSLLIAAGWGGNSYDNGSIDTYYYGEYGYDPVWGYLYDCWTYDYQVSQGTGYQAVSTL